MDPRESIVRIHPKIWKHVLKIYQRHYRKDYQNVLLALSLEQDVPSLKFSDLESFFGELSIEDGLKIIWDILENEDVKLDEYNNWNFFGDYVRDWRSQLLGYLRENGIEYDESSKTFRYIEGGIIPITKKIRGEPLLDIEFKEHFYDSIVDEMNRAYESELYTSVMLLSRKLLENLVIDVLRIKYPPNISGNLEIYFIEDKGRFQDFTVLLHNLEERKEDFGLDEDLIKEFVSLVKPFRPRANATVHSIIITSDETEIGKFNIRKMVALLNRLLTKLKGSGT